MMIFSATFYMGRGYSYVQDGYYSREQDIFGYYSREQDNTLLRYFGYEL